MKFFSSDILSLVPYILVAPLTTLNMLEVAAKYVADVRV